MTLIADFKEKGKSRTLPEDLEQIEPEDADAPKSSVSDSDSDSDSESDETDEADSSDEDSEDEEVSQEFLQSLLNKARQNMIAKAEAASSTGGEEEVINLGGIDGLESDSLPPLDPGNLPQPYLELPESAQAGPSKIRVRDLDVEQAEKSTASKTPDMPAPPPSARPAGKPLTKKEQKALKSKTAGKSWFDLPAPVEADLPRLYREVEALRLRNQLDPKRFYRKEEGEGKGIKGLPKYFAIGTIIPDATPFASSNPSNLPKSARKRTLVDELVDDAETKSYAKKKFKDLQSVRGAKGKATLRKKLQARKPKW
ncbi:Fcf2 pre-rRNA processing-domain-containing protein [Phanerochaete sordida]|uniref:Fcf2 pre-rRNA processing-domain-containing protein n=1 Tax=Phanerochaete sordida TaxID=48140 RepID=A0A9P3GRA5_9APHY|nr:Fcf2 pre-rRNA processing-domain-containing protein [Phanerochaete sordida]